MTEHRPRYQAFGGDMSTSKASLEQTERQPLVTVESLPLDHQSSITLDAMPYVEAVPDAFFVEQARALSITAKTLYQITVHYHALPDGTYEVAPVGDNSFTTITSAGSLCQAILDQITTFMESPAFITSQIKRLSGVRALAEGGAW